MATKPTWSISARTGPTRKHKKLAFFACEGLIALFDERHPEEDYSIHLPADFERRAVALAQYGKECCEAGNTKSLLAEGRLCLQGARDMEETLREAKDMGDPSDPAVQAYWARHRGRKSTVSLHAGAEPGGYPILPPVSLGPDTGRTANVSGQLPAVAAETHLRVHRPVKKKPRGGLLLDV